MLKIFLAATLLGGLSTMVALPDSSKSSARLDLLSPASIVTLQPRKADRLQTRVKVNARNFVSPRRNGNRVAFCLPNMAWCGKEAADAFCRSAGFTEALNFQRDRAKSHSARLLFRQIKCRNFV